MRKFLLFVIATMMSVAMMAAGGDGSSKANAIDFDWVDGHEHVGTAWYRVDLSEINGLVDPTLALYLTNLADESVKVNVEEVSATISVSLPGGFGFSKDTTMSGGEYTIGARDYKLWSQNVKMLLELNVRYLHLKLNAEQKIMLSAKKYETSDIVDIACEDADDFDWSGVQVEAGEKWYRLNLAAVKAQNKKLNFVVANQGSEDATVTFDLSLDCPASVVFGYNWTIPAGGEMTEEFGRVFIDELKEDYVYLKLNTNQALNLRVEEVPAPAPKDETWVVADVLTEGQAYTFSGEHIFEVPMATLSAPRGMKAEFVITNNSNEDATLTKQISFANPVKTTIDKELTVAANATVTKEVVNNMAGVINSQTAYIRFDATQELTVQLNYVVVNEEVMNAKPVEIATCEKSQLLDWNSSIKQSGLETKWYEIDLSTIKQNDEHLQLTFTNKSNNIVVVMGEILRACEGDTLPYICPVPAGMSVSQVINYNMFALLQYPDHFYISATVIPTTATSIMEFKDVRTREDLMKFVPKDLNTIQDAEVELTANTISALVDPNACNQATTIARGVKYEQAAGTTKWYRVTDELLNKLSLLPDVAFINNGKQAANLTLAASVDCEHSTFGMSTFTLPTWADLTVFPIRLLGDLMDKALNQDVTEVYLQVTTDQPIAFGVDIDYGFGLGCDDAREFDWTKGAVIEKGDAQWLSFDISSVKQNKQQVKLTLTNESNSIAWVGMMVSLTCPFDVALPMVFPIPAGASVDKVVDYSYFAATKLDQLYIALITEEKISLKAVAEEATASPMDKLACENAIEVESGETYENKGTQWYKFSGQLFSDMSRLPRFMFATPEGKTKVTVGATVGCEYNIATRVTLPLPGNLDLSFRFPSRIFDLIRKFVHQDVTEVYLEMTTDKKLVWSIDMTYVDACETAIELDFSKPIKLDLKANEDVWYKVDVNSIKGLKNKNLELALYNNNDKAVDIEVEVSPTCPVVVSASKTKSIAAYDSLVYTVPTSQVLAIHDRLLEAYPILKGLSENLVYYVRVRANGDLTVNTDTVTPPPTPEGCENAQLLDWTKTINLSELQTGWYKFDISSIHANKKDFTLSLNNDMGEKKNLGFTFYQDCDTYLFGPLVLSFPVGITEQTIPYSMMTLLGGMDMLYVYLELDAKLPCEDAILFDWNKGAYQEANKTQWYEFDITPVLEQEKQVKLTFTNHSNENAWVVAELALSCPYAVSIPIIVPVPANMSVDKWIDYSVFEASKLKHCYLGVTTREAAIELAATWEDARVTPSDGCLNATLVQTDSLYEHAAGTHWYKFTGDLFDGEGKFSRVHLINRSAKTVNITAGATVGCEYNIATRTKMKLPMRFDLAFAIPVWVVEQMKRFVDNDVKEFYLELTTDQPIAFSFGMDACEEAIPFDWANGHTQEALTTQWYEVDITSVIENKQQVKLTFTNHSNTIAWVASLVSLDCPFKVAMPVMLPIPAGMSVDHVIDYSYFAATRLQHLYVGVTTEEKISIIAEAQDATASSTDQAACANAIEVKSGEVYENRGTQWYKFSGAFFEDASRFPQFMFAAPNGQANVTLGATVGCEYNIANRGTFTLPNTNGLSLAFRFPSFIFDVIKKFVNPAVTEFYLEMTSDKQVDWSLNMDYVGTCASAVDLDLSQPIHLDLKANEDVWYKVDLNAIKALGNKEIEYAIVNGTNDAVEIVAEVSPSCPVVLSAAATHSIAANDSLVGTIPAKLITTAYDNLLTKYSDYDVLLGDLIYYVRVRATGDLTVDADTITPETPDFVESCKDAELLDWTKTINLSDLETGWYKLNISSLRANKQDFTLSLNNNTGDVKKLRFFFYEDCSDIESELENLFLTSLSVTAPKGLTTEKVPYAALNYLLGDDVDEFYVYLEIEGGELNEACLNAMLLDDPNVPHTIQLVAGKEQWFKVATNALEKLQYNLKVSVDAEVSDVTVSVSSSCLVEPIIDTTVVLDKARHEEVELSKTTILDKWSKYSSKVSDIDTAYVRVLSTGNITLNTDTVTPTPPADPDDCENATLLDWTQTINLSTLTTGWYKFDLSSLHASQSDFTLSLNNDMGETKAVEMTLYLSCDQPYEAKTTQVFPVGITTRQVAYSLLTQVVGTADMVYVYIKTDIQVPVIPEADACLNAIELTWNDTLDINAGDTTWYMLPLAEAKALGKDLTLTVINPNDADADVYVAVAETCPVLAYLTERTGIVPANMTISRTLTNSELNSLADTVYFRLHSTQDLTISAAVAVEEPEQPQGCEDAILLDWTKTINLSDLKTGWYKFDISSIHTANKDFTLSLNNDLGEAKNLGFRLYKDCDSPMMGETVMTFPVGITSRTIPASLLSLVDGIDMLYVYLTIDAPLPCEDAILFDWNKGAYQEANKTQWYEFDITPVLEQEKQVKLTFTNHSNENAWVIAELAFHCPYTKSIPIIVPVPANMSVDKWIDYSAFEASRIEHFYLGVTTREAAIELAATWEDARVTPSDGCLNATLVENDVLYEHAAGTHWYKFTGDLFEGEGSFSRVHVINRSAKTVNITAGGTVGCEYNIATRTNFKLPRRFDLAFAIPVWVVEQMKKFIDDDVTEFYLELTTDQPIAFSFGMDACEEAIPFDWTTGHTQEALTTQWYNVDIAPVLANEQQIKLTFTNHSDQTAWVGTLVSLNCPFKVALPLAFPIPAGMSVDKVIDYSYFAATRLDQLYVGVTTDSKISVIAEAQSAIAHPNDKAACASAKTLKVDENNIHPAGTAWYKVDGSLFADMERLPKFRFETVSGETTTVTIGATVGCDYNIATRGTVKMPGGLDMYLRAPRFIFSVIEKFIDDDVNEFYVELTTDKDVEFTIFADHDEDLTACSSATDFVLSDSMTISLEADKDVWYKVDMKALKANDQDWSISVVNPSDKAVDVEVEVSPTCPMVASAMKEFTVPASVNVATVITSEQIATYIAKFPNLVYYVRIRATEDLTIEVTEPEVVEDVEACYEAIDYIYGTDIVLSGESDVWYKLNIKELRDKDEIITLTVTNNSTDTAKATLDIYDTCPVEYPILSMKDVVVDPLQVISRKLEADELPGDVDSIYLHVRAIGSLTINLSTEEEPQPEHVFAYDTIAQYYCPADLPLVTSWNDTVKVTELLDSVYTYNAKELIAPVALTMQEVSDILGTNFSLVAGTTPDMSASVADIKTHYATIDNEQTADVVNVSWTVTSIPCGATSDTLTLLVTDECDNVVSAQYVFDIVSQTVTTVEETITICSHELPYEWNSMQYTAAGTHTTTKTNIYGCDSAKYILHLNVLPEIPVTNVYDTVCYGESYTWNVNNQTYDATGQYSVTLVSSTNCDSVVTLNLTVLPDVVTQEENVTICYGETYTWPVSNKEYKRNGKYIWLVKSAQGCDSVNHILNLTVLPAVEKQALVTAHICYGEKYDWRGKQYTVAGIYGDTLRNVAGCDSVIYTLNLTASAAPIDSMTRVMLCAGDSYKWDVNGQSYMYPDQGTYNDTYVIKDQYDCDSIICELELVVSDGLYPYSETVCYGESYDLIVDGITHTFNTSGTHVVRSQNGCQVTLFLTVLDEILPTDIYQTICYGESYDWEHDTFTQLGDYTKTLISSLGCDSVVTLHLTVLPEVVGQTEHKTVCFGETYEWHQVTYSASGTYTASLQDNNGCTYTDTLILTILDEVPETKVDKYLCEGDSMLWDGQYIKQSGLYPVTLQDSHGCDSLVTLNLTFVQGSDSTIYKTICSGGTYVFQNQTLTQSGTYVDTIAECNTTITLHLTVNQAITVEVTEVVNGCAYDWNGVTYTTSGDYTYKTTGINGCDSTTILHLTLVPTVVNAPVDTVTLCYGGTHPWRDGETYSTAGTYTYVEKNANDCDSTRYTLELIVREKVEPTIIEQTICYEDKSYTWDVTGLTYDTTGYYKQTLTDVNGCDSIVTLHLVVFDEILPTSFRDTINEGDSYTWNGKTYTTAGDYIDTIPSTITGCDSIVTLSLHVIPQKRIEVANITAYVCDGTEYIDPVTNKKHIITSLIPSTQTWSDTIVKSPVLDSIYNYVITPIVAPEVMTDATLASIAVAPVLTQGVLPDMSGTVAAIMAYYNGNDTEAIADVNNIYWTDASLNTVVPCGATTHTMTLVVEAGCDNKITTTHTFDVLPVMGVTETVVACDSYTWNGQTYTTSGDYTFTGQTAAGCDSVAILHLTINNSVQVEETATACDSYTWSVDGKTYTTSGDYTFTGQTATGCDSIVTLHLTINKSVYTEDIQEACDSYDWNGMTLTANGIYTHTFQTAAGCDSIVTLRLTINKSFYKEVSATACDSYTWDVDGKTYTTSGDYTFNGKTAAGCDSTHVLHLTINQSFYKEETATACDSYTWSVDGKTYTTSGDYTFTGQTAAGCDSVAILHLTINNSVQVEETATACDSYTWDVDGKTYTTSGDYTFTGQTATGCDSIVTLHLTINKPAYTEIYETTCDSYDWYTGTLTESGVYVHTLQTTAGCDSIVTLRLTINKSFYKEVSATACDSYTWSVDGKTYTTSGDYTFNGQTAAGCDSIVTLHLTINNSVQVEETVVACDSYTWNGKTYTTSGDYTFNGQTAAGCDSVAILHLTILPDVVYEPAETDYLCPASTYEWRNHTYDAPGTYYDTVYYSLGCDSVIYTLELLQYVNTLPAITADDIVAVCGEAVNVQEADAIIRAHISNEALYAPNADVKWYVLSGNTYEELTNTAIDGTVTEVTLKYTVTTDCGVVESDPIVVTVVPNSPEHDDTLADIPAYNKYGGRLLTVDVKYIRETFGLEVTEDEVTWYLENGDNDIEQGKGYYLTTEDGTPLPAGQYYALINYQGKSNVECDIILQTITLVVETQVGPMLLPTVAKPDELIRVLNLDSDATSTITIYSSTGQQLDSFQVKDAKETSFNAAHVAGYYIVEVQTESDKVSLRYVVK